MRISDWSSDVCSSDLDIHIADIFDNPEVNGDKVIAQAPSPGRRIALEAAWLYRVARAYHIDWRPASRYDRAVVKRARSEERRVGNEWVRTCGSRWSA